MNDFILPANRKMTLEEFLEINKVGRHYEKLRSLKNFKNYVSIINTTHKNVAYANFSTLELFNSNKVVVGKIRTWGFTFTITEETLDLEQLYKDLEGY